MENNKNCENCGQQLRPAPARWDGEFTFVGYFPCSCKIGINAKQMDLIDASVKTIKESHLGIIAKHFGLGAPKFRTAEDQDRIKLLSSSNTHFPHKHLGKSHGE